MMQQRVSIHYADGAAEEAVITQAELGAFEKWAARNGFAPSKPGRALVQEMPVMFLRFGAWAALFRGAATKPAFEKWDPTVVEVEALDTEQAPDPTQTDTQGEP